MSAALLALAFLALPAVAGDSPGAVPERFRVFSLPISASAWHDGALLVRLSGSEAGVRAAASTLGGDRIAAPSWTELREHTVPFFSGAEP